MMATLARRAVYNTDCEGPTVSNDNAAEAAERFIEHGKRLFAQLSRFDDYTAYVMRRPHYNAGDTLRLLLPVLKAWGVSDAEFTTWTRSKGVKWIHGAKKTVAFAQEQRLETFEISASYRPFAALVADGTNIPSANVYCTDLSLDRFSMGTAEARRVGEIGKLIASLSDLPETESADLAHRFSKREQASLDKCESLIWDEMATKLACSSQMLREVRAMGGAQKAAAIRDTMRRTGAVPQDVIYIADSITDVEAFRELRHLGGVTISFNGNRHAVGAAQYATWGNSSLVNALLLAVFLATGRDGLTHYCQRRGRVSLKDPQVTNIRAALKKSDRTWGCDVVNSRTETRVRRLSKRFRDLTRAEAASLS